MNTYRLLIRILRAKRKGLLRLRLANEDVVLSCLGEACPRNCCEILGPPKLEETERYVPTLVELAKQEGCFGCPLMQERKCSAYLNRPRSCREYPWYTIDGRLYYDAGCPGIMKGRGEQPSIDSIQPLSFYLQDANQVSRLLLILLFMDSVWDFVRCLWFGKRSRKGSENRVLEITETNVHTEWIRD